MSYLIDYGAGVASELAADVRPRGDTRAVLLFVGMLFQRESPHWLVRQDREDEARDVLRRVRAHEDDIDAEIDEVREVARREAELARVALARRCGRV